jgi:hypothetical protein
MEKIVEVVGNGKIEQGKDKGRKEWISVGGPFGAHDSSPFLYLIRWKDTKLSKDATRKFFQKDYNSKSWKCQLLILILPIFDF